MSESTTTAPAEAGYTPEQAEQAFSKSVVISGVRCLFTYIVFPWLLPALGVARGWGPWLGVIISPIAITFNVLSIRRFQRSGHKYRWPITVVNVTIIGLLVVLFIRDAADILS